MPKPILRSKSTNSAFQNASRVDNFIGALSGDPTKLAEIAIDEVTNKLEDKSSSKFIDKSAVNAASLAFNVTRAISGDPFAQIEFGIRMVEFLANNAFDGSITIPSNVKLKNDVKFKPNQHTQPKSKSKIVRAIPSSNSAKSSVAIDDTDSQIEDVDISFAMTDLIEMNEFPLSYEGNSFEELQVLLAKYQAEFNGNMFQRRQDEVSQVYQSDILAIKSKLDPLIASAKAGNYDPNGSLAQLRSELQQYYFERDQALKVYNDAIDEIKSELDNNWTQIQSTKSNIQELKDARSGLSREELEIFNSELSSLYELKNELYSDKEALKQQLSQAYHNLRNNDEVTQVNTNIELVRQYIRDHIQSYTDQLYARKSELITELNERTNQQRQQIIKLQDFLKAAMNSIRNTIVKNKSCNWGMCVGEHHGGSKAFNLNFGQLEYFINKGFNEQESCQTCIDYKKFVNSKAQSNDLRLHCQGATIIGSGGVEEIVPCQDQSYVDLSPQHVIGRPKKRGEPPYKLDGTDKYQCKSCSKAQTDSESQVPFIDLPSRVQEMIDGYIEANMKKSQQGSIDEKQNLIQSRFYYAVMYDILTSTVVNTGLSVTTSIANEASNANYEANYYEVTPQSGSSLESAGLHLLKHMLDLGEQFNAGTWSNGIAPGSHDQQTLRNVLGQPNFTHQGNPSTPRQHNGVVQSVNYPTSLDTLTTEARTFLQIGLDKISEMNNGLEGFGLVSSRGVQKSVINPFTELLTVYSHSKVCTSYYMNSTYLEQHTVKFQKIVSDNIQTWYQAAQAYYGLGGAGYMLDPDSGNNIRLEFATKSCIELIATPNLGWIDPKNLEWNL